MSSTNMAATEWSAVAPAWDANTAYVDAHSGPATDALVEAVAPRAGDRLLELAAGPGSLGATWSALVGDSGSVVLSDVAEAMVAVARRRSGGLPNVAVEALDASAIDRPDGSFDVVVCRMGLMFVPDPAAAFGECFRVLDAGGRFGALTWAAIDQNPWMTCVGMAGMVNGVLSGGPPVGPGMVFSLGDPAALRAHAAQAGFVDVAVTEIPVVFEVEDIGAHVDRVSSLAGSMAAAFAAASPEQLAAVKGTAAQLAADHAAGAGFALPGRALLVRGRRP